VIEQQQQQQQRSTFKCEFMERLQTSGRQAGVLSTAIRLTLLQASAPGPVWALLVADTLGLSVAAAAGRWP